MGWQSLGSVSLGLEWSNYPIEVVGSQTFKIIQSYNRRPYGRALISQYFPVLGGRSTVRPLYPNADAVILDLKIPLELLNQSEIVRTLQIKRTLPDYPDLIWNVEIQAYY